MDVPVLYIIFNRLDAVKLSFAAIRKAQPSVLYVAADGPRADVPGEAEACEAVRSWVLSNIDWPCSVHTYFQSVNCGCGHHPAGAISWMFEKERYGIILEDDCIASASFFVFAEEMLRKYECDSRFSIICGSNFDTSHQYMAADSDYFFSKISYTWGWATWKRTWEKYDFTMRAWGHDNHRKLLKWLFDEKEYREYWRYIFDSTYKNQPQDLWDYQFFYLCYRTRQLAIVPNVNLVSNIGFGENATHTVEHSSKIGMPLFEMTSPFRHPSKVQANADYDRHVQEFCYGKLPVIPWHKNIKRKIKSLLRYK